IAGILTTRGYNVLEATRGEEAIHLARTHEGPVDLALVDVVMPEMSGPDLIRQIEPLRPGMRVLYISGYTEEAMVHHGIPESGAFLRKPFLPDALARKIFRSGECQGSELEHCRLRSERRRASCAPGLRRSGPEKGSAAIRSTPLLAPKDPGAPLCTRPRRRTPRPTPAATSPWGRASGIRPDDPERPAHRPGRCCHSWRSVESLRPGGRMRSHHTHRCAPGFFRR